MKRASATPAVKKGDWACPDPAFLKNYPTLAQGMSDTWWEDGKPRELWTLTVRFDTNSVNLCVNDRGANMGLYTTGESLDDALALLEECLSQGTASWRRWRK